MENNEEVKALPATAGIPMHPDEIYKRNLAKMNNRQLASHLRRQARRSENLKGAWAVALGIVLSSKASAYLR
jgi:hypothetical protein